MVTIILVVQSHSLQRKNAQLINELGMDVQNIYNVKYLPSDFKKNKGYERSIEMCNDYNIF